VDAVEPAQSPDADPVAGQPVRLTGRDAFRLHLTLAAGLIVCCGAFAFELARALGGHSFSWMYVFEWPLFAAFAVYMWWNLLQGHDRVRRPPAPRSGGATASPPDDELEAWNRYVLSLEADRAPDTGRPALSQTRPSARSSEADTPPSVP
jgi:hypothetical protein